jgi:hypothetical protein
MARSSTESKHCYQCDNCGRITNSPDPQSVGAICTHCCGDGPSVDGHAGNTNEAAVAVSESVPENQDIYIAFRNIPSLTKSIKTGQKKSDSVVANRQTMEDVRQLIEKYGIDDLKARVKQLVTKGVFKYPYIAQNMFPGLFDDMPAAETVDKTAAEDNIPGAVNPDELIPKPSGDAEALIGETVQREVAPANAVNRTWLQRSCDGIE